MNIYHMQDGMRGITLIETMIYIALFGVIMTGAVVASWQVMDAGQHTESMITIQEEGMFLMRKINWALTGASAVVTDGTSTLIITRPDLAALTPSQSPITISASGTSMMLARGTGMPLAFNDDTLAVTHVSFSVTPASAGRPTSTSVSFLVQDTPFTFTTYVR